MNTWTERLLVIASIVMILYGVLTIYERTVGLIFYWQNRAMAAEQTCKK